VDDEDELPPVGIVGGVTCRAENGLGGTRVDIEGAEVATEMFARLGSSPVERLSSGLLIQHRSV